MDDLLSQIRSQAMNAMLEKENDLLIEALRRATGEKDPNPYGYINRLSKWERVDGTMIYFDKQEILFIHKPTFSHADEQFRTTINVQYQHFLPERKNES